MSGTVPLGDVATLVRNGIFASRPNDEGVGVPILRISAVRDGRVSFSDLKYVPMSPEDVDKYAVREKDLLITRYNGSRHLVGISGLVSRHAGPVLHPDKLIRVTIDPSRADSRFVNLQLASPQVRTFLEPRIRTTAGQSGIAGADVRAIPLWVPPLEEQQRIVDVLEDLLSRLDAGDAALFAGQRRLVALEQSVLSQLYARGESQELGEVASIQGGIQKQPKRAPVDHAFPFLRVANVTSFGLDLTEVHRIELFEGELEKLRLQPGDLLVVEGNGSASQIGRAATWDGSINDCVHQNHLIRVRPDLSIRPDFLEAVWNSPQNRRQLSELASSTSGLHTLSVSKLKRLQVPVVPLSQQEAAVAAVTEIRDMRDRLGATISAAQKRASALRRSLLMSAFSGRLTAAEALEGSDV